MKQHIVSLLLGVSISLNIYAPRPEEVALLIEGKKNIIPVAVIGGGPAGLAATIPPARGGFYTVAFQGPKPLGELIDALIVENWPGMKKTTGMESMLKLERQALSFGAVVVPLEVTQIDLSQWPFVMTLSDGTQAHALTVIIATGASQKKLGIKGEDTYWGKGLFSCGMCDATFTKDKDTIVIGGGDIAIQRALQLSPKAKSVTLIVPEPKMSAHESMQKKLKDMHNIKMIYNKEVVAIEGDGAMISHVNLVDTKTKRSSTLPTQSVFLSTSLTPNTELFKDQLELDNTGCIKLKEGRTQETDIEGVLAAGTVADPRYRQIPVVTGDATKAAIDAMRLLSKWGFDGPLRRKIESNLYKPTIMENTHIQELKQINEFRKIITRSSLPVLVEFYAPTCPTCRKMEMPVISLAQQFNELIKILKINREKFETLLQQQDVSILPAFILFKNGKEIGRKEGEATKEDLCKFVEDSCELKPRAGVRAPSIHRSGLIKSEY